MPAFPILDKQIFVKTREQLHSIAKIFGKIRETLVKPTAKNENLWLEVYECGFQIPIIEQYGSLLIRCNLTKLRIEVKDPKFVYTIDLEENTLHDEAEELLRILSELKIDFESTRIRLNADADIVIDRESSSHFLTQLGNFDGLLRSFWNSIHTGTKTGIYLWPEHFDNAFIWYSGRKVNGSDEQIGIGVSNGDDEILLSYIYMNPWPVPLDIDKIELAEGTYFHSQGWTGFVLPYDQVQGKNGYEQQKELINNFFISTFEKINNEFKKR